MVQTGPQKCIAAPKIGDGVVAIVAMFAHSPLDTLVLVVKVCVSVRVRMCVCVFTVKHETRSYLITYSWLPHFFILYGRDPFGISSAYPSLALGLDADSVVELGAGWALGLGADPDVVQLMQTRRLGCGCFHWD